METSGTKTLPDLLREKVALHPDKDFVVFEDAGGVISSLTYGQFAEQVSRLASALIAQGVQAGQKVAVMLSNSPEFLLSWFGINQAGAVMVPVNVFYSPDELQYLLNSSDSVGFITEPKFVGLFSEIGSKCPAVRVKLLARTEVAQPEFGLLKDVLSANLPSTDAVRVPSDPDCAVDDGPLPAASGLWNGPRAGDRLCQLHLRPGVVGNWQDGILCRRDPAERRLGR